MTPREYNTTGVLGARAARHSASALAHLPLGLGGRAPIAHIAGQIYARCMRAKRPISPQTPILWRLEPRYIQLRQGIVSYLGSKLQLEAVASGLDYIHIIGVYAPDIGGGQ
jgi:hypothetical protein